MRATDLLRSKCGGGRRSKISKQKVNVLRHTRGRLSLLHSTPLRLGLFRFPGPCSLGLAGGAMEARRWWDAVEVGRE